MRHETRMPEHAIYGRQPRKVTIAARLYIQGAGVDVAHKRLSTRKPCPKECRPVKKCRALCTRLLAPNASCCILERLKTSRKKFVNTWMTFAAQHSAVASFLTSKLAPMVPSPWREKTTIIGSFFCNLGTSKKHRKHQSFVMNTSRRLISRTAKSVHAPVKC